MLLKMPDKTTKNKAKIIQKPWNLPLNLKNKSKAITVPPNISAGNAILPSKAHLKTAIKMDKAIDKTKLRRICEVEALGQRYCWIAATNNPMLNA